MGDLGWVVLRDGQSLLHDRYIDQAYAFELDLTNKGIEAYLGLRKHS